jgi:hypothetical protein
VNYYEPLIDNNHDYDNYEIVMVSAGIGQRIGNTYYKNEMKSTNKEKWKMEIDEEHKRMTKHKVWEPVKM